MKYFLKGLYVAGFSILGIALIVSLYLISAYVFSRISVNKNVVAGDDVRIYILTNGVHTDIVMPLRNEMIDWSKEFKFQNTVSKDSVVQYVSLGWGDKGFYLETPTWADLTVKTAFKAAFWLGHAAIHCTFYKEMKEGLTCKHMDISKEQYAQLIDFVHQSLSHDKEGNVLPIATNAFYGNYDSFYEAQGKYSMFHTCNTWANNGLKSCGQRASLWTPFDTGIFYHYQ